MELERKIIKDFPKYEIDNTGNIYIINSEKQKTIRISNQGYAFVTLYNKGARPILVHYLVLITFKGGPPNDGQKYSVDHIDCIRNNNIIDNLRWATATEQVQNSSICLTQKSQPNKYRPIVLTDKNGNITIYPKIDDALDYVKITTKRQAYYALKDGNEKDGYFWSYLPLPNIEFKLIPKELMHGTDGYEASKEGYIKTPKGNIISGFTGACRDYKVITVNKHEYRVHRLILGAYIEPDTKKPWVNHVNGIKTDNRLENLEWTNASENGLHAVKLGLIKEVPGRSVDKYDLNNIFIVTYKSLKEAAKSVNTLNYSNIIACCKGRQIIAYGHKWKYTNPD